MKNLNINLFQPTSLPEMENAAVNVLRSGNIANGKSINKLEVSFSKLIGKKNFVAVNNLTSSLIISLHLAGVKAGDKVAISAFNCLQSTIAIARLSAIPIWIDIEPLSMTMCIDDLKSKLSKDIKAVVLYHIAGYPSDSEEIYSICHSFQIPLIEDCNNALGAKLNGKPVGVIGDYSVYSFYPTRQINGIDGGILSTPNLEKANYARRLRRFGIDHKSFRDNRGEINPKSDIPTIGWSAALNNLHAAIALSQIPTLSERQKKTNIVAESLYHSLSKINNLVPVKPIKNSVPSYWGFLVLLKNRDEFLFYLKQNGINASCLHHRNDTYSGFGRNVSILPGTQKVISQMIALPCGWWLKDEEIDKLLSVITSFSFKY